MPQFSIDAWAKRTILQTERVVIAIKFELFSSIINDTRVDTGLLRGNWQTSEMDAITGAIERFDQSGALARRQAKATITADGISIMTNNLDYAQVWEELDAMMAKNVVRLEQIVRAKISEGRK